MKAQAAPRPGDLVVLDFDPQAGHEQKGRRPALVVSNEAFAKATGLVMVCPITRTARGVPFHVALPDDAAVTGFIMVEQVKSVDYRFRRWKRIGLAPRKVTEEALSILAACLV